MRNGYLQAWHLWFVDQRTGLTGEGADILGMLVKICVQFYFKIYFDILLKLENGPPHILTDFRIFSTLSLEGQATIRPIVQTGAWFSHSECCLLSLLTGNSDSD